MIRHMWKVIACLPEHTLHPVSKMATIIACSGLHAGGKETDAMYSRTGHQHHQRCWGTVTSGLPPNTPLFNGSICRYFLWLCAVHNSLHTTRCVQLVLQVRCSCLLVDARHLSGLPSPLSACCMKA